jgi:hypothetical protein
MHHVTTHTAIHMLCLFVLCFAQRLGNAMFKQTCLLGSISWVYIQNHRGLLVSNMLGCKFFICRWSKYRLKNKNVLKHIQNQDPWSSRSYKTLASHTTEKQHDTSNKPTARKCAQLINYTVALEIEQGKIPFSPI